MRISSLTPLALLIGVAISGQAQASGDDSCYPVWSLQRDSLDVCNNLVFLNPGNDSRMNLRLLLADRKALALTPEALSDEEKAEGFGPVPFAVARLALPVAEDEGSVIPETPEFGELLQKLGVKRDSTDSAGDEFLQGEGSRCRSNRDDSAGQFIEQLLETPSLSDAERQALARSRLQLLGACTWDAQAQTQMLPNDNQSAEAKGFAAYLQAASDFYSGRFADAERGFAGLSESSQPWLKETALYMVARTRLNDAQKDAFDEYGTRKDVLDAAPYTHAGKGFDAYLAAYPQGRYALSAKGLMRRVHWLSADSARLADDFTEQMSNADDTQRNVSMDALIQEADNKLLGTLTGPTASPLITATRDLMLMRPGTLPALTQADLAAQKNLFAQQPAMFDYLQAAFAFYVDKQPAQALKLLPDDLPASLDYLAFSQQTLRGLSLEALNDLPAAQRLWLSLLPLAKQPLQREQLELALALNYERSGQVDKVFAADSHIQSAQVRLILLDKAASAALLRQQISQGISDTEKATAQFVLLYKDLMRGQYSTFAEDLKALPAMPSETKLTTSLGYVFDMGRSLSLFRWKGDKAESNYSCPGIDETAALLRNSDKDPKGLNCLGEFVLRNGLDSMPLDQRPAAGQLGSSESGFKGEAFSRLNGYQTVIADNKAPRDDKAYALFRAINCYAPSGYNSCGGKDVAPAVRKGWFKQLKTTYGATSWGKSLQYYW